MMSDWLGPVLTVVFIGLLAAQALGYKAMRRRMDPRQRAVVDYLRALAHAIEFGDAFGGIVSTSPGWTTVEVTGEEDSLPVWAGEPEGSE